MRHLLVIDDDPDSLRLARRLFERDGHRVTTLAAPDLSSAQVARLAPDLILLDYWFAGAPQALSFLRALGADARTAAIPVLLVSAAVHAVAQARAELTALGCRRILVKPCTIGQLRAAVDDLLGGPAWPLDLGGFLADEASPGASL